jgi:hypothetical protein
MKLFKNLKLKKALQIRTEPFIKMCLRRLRIQFSAQLYAGGAFTIKQRLVGKNK